GKMQDVSLKDGRTVLFVSHNMAAVSQLCSMGMLLQDGIIALQGEINETIDRYLIHTEQSFFIPDIKNNVHKDAYFKEIRIRDSNGRDNTNFLILEPIFIAFKIKINKNKEKYNLFCMILDHRLNRVFAAEAEMLEEEMLLRINPNFLVRGKYSIHAFINIPRQKQEDVVINVCQFEIFDNSSNLAKHGSYDYGSVVGNYTWV
ncbi:MAG: Wzt carbohydrate-binding domain-containing protein, partial [Bacteroidetes bacterium]|nr:Wzt carbohydrate-binding domain-containing protein [Bacteroidota bacterium]